MRHFRIVYHFSGFLVLVLLLMSVSSADVFAQEAYHVTRLSGPIVIDGLGDEDAWDAAEPMDMFQYGPVPGGPLSEMSDIRIGYDDNYFYATGHFSHDDPETVTANSLYRDRYSGDDVFAVILDTFDDNENALWFSTTPAGIRIDRSVSNDAEFIGGGFESVMNESWNTYWDVASTETDNGWSTELRIPFSSLGFQSIDDRVEMGLIIYRFTVHNNERQIYPSIPPNWSIGFAKPSQAQTIVLTGVESNTPIYITPYVTGGIGQMAELPDGGSKYSLDDDVQRDLGLDVKFPLTNNLTIDATVNTDFAQVEADDQQVNLTRFSLFFPEKRQFFQERSGIFGFSTDNFDRVFYSRRIGLSDDGIVRILGGGRLVGRIGNWDIGLLNMQTESTSSSPSENFGVLRLRRRVLNDQSSAGGIFTSRIGDEGAYNLVYGLDGVFKVSEKEFISAKWIQTFEDEPYASSSFDFRESIFGQLRVERRGTVGWGFSTVFSYSGRDYNPGIGFVLRRAYTSAVAALSYGWISSESSPFRNVRPGVDFSTYFRNHDKSLESLMAKHSWSMETKSGADLTPFVTVRTEDLDEDLSFPEDVMVPMGRYSFATAGLEYSFPENGIGPIRTDNEGNEFSFGTFYDGTQLDFKFSPVWSISRFLEFTVPYRFSRLTFSDRDQRVDVHLLGLRTQVGFSTKVSINSLVQYNTAQRMVSGNVRFRYNFREGNDLWVVLNQNMNTDRMREEIALPVVQNRTVLLKYTHTFIR